MAIYYGALHSYADALLKACFDRLVRNRCVDDALFSAVSNVFITARCTLVQSAVLRLHVVRL